MVQVCRRQPDQEGSVGGAHLPMIGSDGFQVAVLTVILTVRTHRQEWPLLDLIALNENMGEVVVEHLAKMLEIPADAGDLRNRLPADLVRAEVRRRPLPETPKV